MRSLFLYATALVTVVQPVQAADPVAQTTVVLANFSFTPQNLHLVAGERVKIHFVNEGSGGHDFAASEFFAHASMDAANRKLVGKKGRVSLGRGESIDVSLTPKRGQYEVHCSHFLHSSFGMTGTITVD